jgi:predicted Zn-dependent protease with MMP-like domain/Tfp pilus assembly protein PilF
MRAVDRGWECLDEGDLEGAYAALRKARSDRPDAPEVLCLSGVVAGTKGEIELALSRLRQASSADPAYALPLIYAAELELYARDDAEAALALCERAFDAAELEEEYADAALLKAEAELALGRDQQAVSTMEDLDVSDCEVPALLIRAGQIYYEIDDIDRARTSFERALERTPEQAAAHHGLGCVYEAVGDRERMIEHWLETLRLDREEPLPEWHISAEEFAEVAECAMAELPEHVRDRLGNVPVLVEELPTVDWVREGIDPRVLGLFSGVPLPEKSALAASPALDSIHLFQHNLERTCRDRDELLEEIRITVLHETGHFFGLDDDDLGQLGLH